MASKRKLDLARLMDVTCNGEFVLGGVLYCKCGERVTRSRESLYDEIGGSRYLPTGTQRCQSEQNGQEDRIMPEKIFGASKTMAPGVSKRGWWPEQWRFLSA